MAHIDKNTFGSFYFITLDFILKVTERIILPPNLQKGYLIRQSIGNALHKTLGDQHIERFWSNKLTPEQHKTLKISKEPPRGYIIEPPDSNKMVYVKNETFNTRLILVGYVSDYVKEFIDAVEFLGNNSGLGISSLNGCGKFKIDKILINRKTRRNLNKKPTRFPLKKIPGFVSADRIKLNFITPAEIKLDNNKSRLMMRDNRDVPYFFISLYKRLYALQSIYCSGIFNEVDYGKIFSFTKNIELNNLAVERINMKIAGKQLAGFAGELLFSGNISSVIPMLILGEHIHIGTETVYGFGKYEIVY